MIKRITIENLWKGDDVSTNLLQFLEYAITKTD